MHGGASLSIGEVARQTGLRPSAIRYYESIGLVPEPERRSGQRRFGTSVVGRLALIRAAQGAGFTLNEVRALFDGFPKHAAASDRWRTMASAKLPEIQELIDRAERMKGWLELLAHCECADLVACGELVLRARTALTEDS